MTDIKNNMREWDIACQMLRDHSGFSGTAAGDKSASRQPAHRVLEHSDFETLLQSGTFPQLRLMQLGSRSGPGRMLLASMGDVGLMSTRGTGATFLRGTAPTDHLTIQVDLGSSAPARVNGQEAASNSLFVFSGAAEFEWHSAQRHHGINLRIPLDLMHSALEAREPGLALPREGTSFMMAACGETIAPLKRLAAPMLRLMDGANPAAATPLIDTAAITDSFLGAVLLSLRRGEQDRSYRPYYQRLPILRAAEEFMRANLARPILLHEICAAARASERSVEYAFNETHGVGAKQYLRLLRLDHVRRELLRRSPSAGLIRAIAASYGFRHMGHFARAYRTIFGETPRQTLRGAAS